MTTIHSNRVTFEETTAPATPATGKGELYEKTDGDLYFLNDAAVERNLSAAASTVPIVVNARVSLTTGLPVTTADVLSATNLYVTPYKGNRVSLWTGSAWVLRTFTELTVAVPATTDTGYDLFLYDNAGVVATELLAWTNLTTRVALGNQNGALVRGSDATRLLIASFRTTGVSGRTEESEAKRFVSNYYNRHARTLYKSETTNSWAYAVAAYRAYNNSAANSVEVFIGYQEDPVFITFNGITDATATTAGSIGIGLDSTTVNSADFYSRMGAGSTVTSHPLIAAYRGFPGLGHHVFYGLEYATGGSVNFYGDNNVTTEQAAIEGVVWG